VEVVVVVAAPLLVLLLLLLEGDIIILSETWTFRFVSLKRLKWWLSEDIGPVTRFFQLTNGNQTRTHEA
jgi:hypothetical protein